MCPHHKNHEEERKFLGYSHDLVDYGWRLATRAADEVDDEMPSLNATEMAELEEWFTKGGEAAFSFRRGGD